MCPWITAKNIIDAKDDPLKDEQYFYNYVLGLPYVASENKISADTVLANCTPDVNTQQGQIVIGVDTGLPVHLVAMNEDGVFFQKRCPQVSASYDPYEDIARLMDRWPKCIVVADQGGDLIGIRKLQANPKYAGRVFLCHYRADRKSSEVARWQEDGTVVVDRNRMMQLVVEMLREQGRYRLNGSKDDFRELAEHFANMYRVAEEGPFGLKLEWKRSGPDHLAHALLYATVGLDRFRHSEATIVATDSIFDGMRTGRMFE